ncbi:MAG: hypothetical protein CMN30_19990 [Sandaracinus sp.]|nr:hypothetical protein [Sandaracinus sp.]|tara:strand:+ start:31 stop:540 length:510 start_codon:yes stop_codon:yes gene_type:complete
MPEPKTGAKSQPTTKPRRPRSKGPRVDGGSKHARKIALLILEVLGGLRTPTDAANALGVSTPRYYSLEAQGLAGLVAACEPKPRGRQLTPEREVEKLQAKVDALEKECARRQALLRLSQRTLGVSASTASKPRPKAKPGKRRKKRPTVRALKAAKQIQHDTPGAKGEER